MVRIGIADDRAEEMEYLRGVCEEYLEENDIGYTIYDFHSGEEVLQYCQNKENGQLDLLFLDIEMPGVDGLEVQQFSRRTEKIFRIAYASSHEELMDEVYDYNVIGFVRKPVAGEKVHRVLDKVMRERMQNVGIRLPQMERELYLEDVEYIRSDRNYVEVYLCSQESYELLTVGMNVLEGYFRNMPVVRVHKSYMVNLMHVREIGREITLKYRDVRIPVGRSYKSAVREQYDAFRRNMVRGRMG